MAPPSGHASVAALFGNTTQVGQLQLHFHHTSQPLSLAAVSADAHANYDVYQANVAATDSSWLLGQATQVSDVPSDASFLLWLCAVHEDVAVLDFALGEFAPEPSLLQSATAAGLQLQPQPQPHAVLPASECVQLHMESVPDLSFLCSLSRDIGSPGGFVYHQEKTWFWHQEREQLAWKWTEWRMHETHDSFGCVLATDLRRASNIGMHATSNRVQRLTLTAHSASGSVPSLSQLSHITHLEVYAAVVLEWSAVRHLSRMTTLLLSDAVDLGSAHQLPTRLSDDMPHLVRVAWPAAFRVPTWGVPRPPDLFHAAAIQEYSTNYWQPTALDGIRACSLPNTTYAVTSDVSQLRPYDWHDLTLNAMNGGRQKALKEWCIEQPDVDCSQRPYEACVESVRCSETTGLLQHVTVHRPAVLPNLRLLPGVQLSLLDVSTSVQQHHSVNATCELEGFRVSFAPAGSWPRLVEEVSECSELSVLSIVNWSLSHVTPSAMQQMLSSGLSELELSNTGLTFLPQLPYDLTSLRLHNNSLTTVKLPNNFDLRHVDLSANQLTSVTFILHALETLNLDDNLLNNTSFLGTSASLQLLSLRNNRLTGIVPQIPYMTLVRLQGNPLTDMCDWSRLANSDLVEMCSATHDERVFDLYKHEWAAVDAVDRGSRTGHALLVKPGLSVLTNFSDASPSCRYRLCPLREYECSSVFRPVSSPSVVSHNVLVFWEDTCRGGSVLVFPGITAIASTDCDGHATLPCSEDNTPPGASCSSPMQLGTCRFGLVPMPPAACNECEWDCEDVEGIRVSQSRWGMSVGCHGSVCASLTYRVRQGPISSSFTLARDGRGNVFAHNGHEYEVTVQWRFPFNSVTNAPWLADEGWKGVWPARLEECSPVSRVLTHEVSEPLVVLPVAPAAVRPSSSLSIFFGDLRASIRMAFIDGDGQAVWKQVHATQKLQTLESPLLSPQRIHAFTDNTWQEHSIYLSTSTHTTDEYQGESHRRSSCAHAVTLLAHPFVNVSLEASLEFADGSQHWVQLRARESGYWLAVPSSAFPEVALTSVNVSSSELTMTLRDVSVVLRNVEYTTTSQLVLANQPVLLNLTFVKFTDRVFCTAVSASNQTDTTVFQLWTPNGTVQPWTVLADVWQAEVQFVRGHSSVLDVPFTNGMTLQLEPRRWIVVAGQVAAGVCMAGKQLTFSSDDMDVNTVLNSTGEFEVHLPPSRWTSVWLDGHALTTMNFLQSDRDVWLHLRQRYLTPVVGFCAAPFSGFAQVKLVSSCGIEMVLNVTGDSKVSFPKPESWRLEPVSLPIGLQLPPQMVSDSDELVFQPVSEFDISFHRRVDFDIDHGAPLSGVFDWSPARIVLERDVSYVVSFRVHQEFCHNGQCSTCNSTDDWKVTLAEWSRSGFEQVCRDQAHVCVLDKSSPGVMHSVSDTGHLVVSFEWLPRPLVSNGMATDGEDLGVRVAWDDGRVALYRHSQQPWVPGVVTGVFSTPGPCVEFPLPLAIPQVMLPTGPIESSVSLHWREMLSSALVSFGDTVHSVFTPSADVLAFQRSSAAAYASRTQELLGDRAISKLSTVGDAEVQRAQSLASQFDFVAGLGASSVLHHSNYRTYNDAHQDIFLAAVKTMRVCPGRRVEWDDHLEQKHETSTVVFEQVDVTLLETTRDFVEYTLLPALRDTLSLHSTCAQCSANIHELVPGLPEGPMDIIDAMLVEDALDMWTEALRKPVKPSRYIRCVFPDTREYVQLGEVIQYSDLVSAACVQPNNTAPTCSRRGNLNGIAWEQVLQEGALMRMPSDYREGDVVYECRSGYMRNLNYESSRPFSYSTNLHSGSITDHDWATHTRHTTMRWGVLQRAAERAGVHVEPAFASGDSLKLVHSWHGLRKLKVHLDDSYHFRYNPGIRLYWHPTNGQVVVQGTGRSLCTYPSDDGISNPWKANFFPSSHSMWQNQDNMYVSLGAHYDADEFSFSLAYNFSAPGDKYQSAVLWNDVYGHGLQRYYYSPSSSRAVFTVHSTRFPVPQLVERLEMAATSDCPGLHRDYYDRGEVPLDLQPTQHIRLTFYRPLSMFVHRNGEPVAGMTVGNSDAVVEVGVAGINVAAHSITVSGTVSGKLRKLDVQQSQGVWTPFRTMFRVTLPLEQLRGLDSGDGQLHFALVARGVAVAPTTVSVFNPGPVVMLLHGEANDGLWSEWSAELHECSVTVSLPGHSPSPLPLQGISSLRAAVRKASLLLWLSDLAVSSGRVQLQWSVRSEHGKLATANTTVLFDHTDFVVSAERDVLVTDEGLLRVQNVIQALWPKQAVVHKTGNAPAVISVSESSRALHILRNITAEIQCPPSQSCGVFTNCTLCDIRLSPGPQALQQSYDTRWQRRLMTLATTPHRVTDEGQRSRVPLVKTSLSMLHVERDMSVTLLLPDQPINWAYANSVHDAYSQCRQRASCVAAVYQEREEWIFGGGGIAALFDHVPRFSEEEGSATAMFVAPEEFEVRSGSAVACGESCVLQSSHCDCATVSASGTCEFGTLERALHHCSECWECASVSQRANGTYVAHTSNGLVSTANSTVHLATAAWAQVVKESVQWAVLSPDVVEAQFRVATSGAVSLFSPAGFESFLASDCNQHLQLTAQPLHARLWHMQLRIDNTLAPVCTPQSVFDTQAWFWNLVHSTSGDDWSAQPPAAVDVCSWLQSSQHGECVNGVVVDLSLSENNLVSTSTAHLRFPGTLARLNLSHNSLSGSFPHSLLFCTELRLLDLSHNGLSGVVPDLTPLPLLVALRLSHNTFTVPLPRVPVSAHVVMQHNSWGHFPVTRDTHDAHLLHVDFGWCPMLRAGPIAQQREINETIWRPLLPTDTVVVAWRDALVLQFERCHNHQLQMEIAYRLVAPPTHASYLVFYFYNCAQWPDYEHDYAASTDVAINSTNWTTIRFSVELLGRSLLHSICVRVWSNLNTEVAIDTARIVWTPPPTSPIVLEQCPQRMFLSVAALNSPQPTCEGHNGTFASDAIAHLNSTSDTSCVAHCRHWPHCAGWVWRSDRMCSLFADTSTVVFIADSIATEYGVVAASHRETQQCRDTEWCSADGQWPESTVGEWNSRNCSDALYHGVQLRECGSDGWHAVVDDCVLAACPAQGQWQHTPVGSRVERQCADDELGRVTRECGVHGWLPVQSTCVPAVCAADGVWQLTPEGMRIELPCARYHVGSLTRVCDGGWSAVVDNCTLAHCTADAGFPRTAAGQVATSTCPSSNATWGGVTTRLCTEHGWLAPRHKCMPYACAAKGEFPTSRVGMVVEVACPDKPGMESRYSHQWRECEHDGNWDRHNECKYECPWDSTFGSPAAGTTVTENCPGVNYAGVMTRHCSHTGWEDVQTNECHLVYCEADDGYPDTPVNRTARLSCQPTWIGSKTRACGVNGWHDATDTCAASALPTESPTEVVVHTEPHTEPHTELHTRSHTCLLDASTDAMVSAALHQCMSATCVQQQTGFSLGCAMCITEASECIRERCNECVWLGECPACDASRCHHLACVDPPKTPTDTFFFNSAHTLRHGRVAAALMAMAMAMVAM